MATPLRVRSKLSTRSLSLLLAAALGTAGIGLGTNTTPAQAKTIRVPTHDKTSPAEAKRVDSVPTPKLGWYACADTIECAMVKLPLDYDNPTGATTEVAVVRVKATDPKRRVGSIFVNPGGPGGSGTDMAAAATAYFSAEILATFDVIGFDPRGTNFSDSIRCFADAGEQGKVLGPLRSSPFPYTKTEEGVAIASSKEFGKACSTTGKPLSAAMSTAEAARDMDVLRRAVGDKKLNYLGFSYGSYLGAVYANMFPDRVRSVVIDGVLNPVEWAGTPATANQPQTDRIGSGDGAAKALRELLLLCDKAGKKCPFSAGNPVTNFEVLANRLKAKPLVFDEEWGTSTFTYSNLVASSLSYLYTASTVEELTMMLADLMILTDPANAVAAATPQKAAVRAAAHKRFADRLAAQAAAKAKPTPERAQNPLSGRYGFPYDNADEAFAGVLCSDGLNPADAASWPAAAAAADLRAKHFGRLWTWSSSPCATKTWTAQDEDAYRGPFNKKTLTPVLVVGSYWDPATPYTSAQETAAIMPRARLLSSTNWGHTAYGTSECATAAIDRYLLTTKLPVTGTVCVGEFQPFTGEAPRDEVADGRGRPAPVTPILPRY